MSVRQYQQEVNRLDKEIAGLEKKKASLDMKAASYSKKASSVSVNKGLSISTIKNRVNQIERYNSESRKASAASAQLSKKIAEKRARRNDAYIKLQKSQQREAKNISTLYTSQIQSISSFPVYKRMYEMAEDSGHDVDYDVFISHAHEDKESFVDELVSYLKERNITIWYDDSQIKWGDSLRKKIDEGLRHSRFGIIVLSPYYIAEGKYWTKSELDALFQMESVNGKLILPIWHNLTKKQVMDFSPIIVGKKAMNTASMTAEEMADNFLELLNKYNEQSGDPHE